MSQRNPLSTSYVVNMPLVLTGGGGGIEIACSPTPSAARPIPLRPGMTLTVFNDGYVTGYFVLGETADVLAATHCMPVKAGAQMSYTIPDDGTRNYKFVSGATRRGATNLVFNWGASGS